MPASSNSQTSDTHIFLLNRHSLPGYPYPHTFNLFLPFLNLLFCASQILRFYPYQLAVPRPFFSGKFNDLHSQSSPVYWNRLCRSFNLTFKGGSTWFFWKKTPISFWDVGFFILPIWFYCEGCQYTGKNAGSSISLAEVGRFKHILKLPHLKI